MKNKDVPELWEKSDNDGVERLVLPFFFERGQFVLIVWYEITWTQLISEYICIDKHKMLAVKPVGEYEAE